jgi:hypothetical protein
LGFESLRPVSRRSFFFQNGLATAADMLVLSLVLCAAAIGVDIVVAPQAALSEYSWQWVIYLLALQLALLGAVLEMSRYRRLTWPAFGAGIIVVAAIIASAITANMIAGFGVLVLSAFTGLFGLALCLDAYRRWLTTELDFSRR